MMRWIVIVIGVVLALFGTVWLLQGLSILPGTFMRGSQLWVIIGGAVALVGLALVVTGARRRPSRL